MSFKTSALVCCLLLTHCTGGTEFPLKDDVGIEKLESVPEVDWENPPAKGIILKFHRWPDEREKAAILEKTTAAGLKMIGELPLFKVWVFEWAELQQTTTAQKVCNSLSALSSLEYCEPDSLQRPATGSIK